MNCGPKVTGKLSHLPSSYFYQKYGQLFFLRLLLCDCSCRVVSAYLASSDSHVNKLAKKELQPLIDAGTLKVPEVPAAIGTKE